MGAKRRLNGTSKVNTRTSRHTDRRTFWLIENIGPEGRCFENREECKQHFYTSVWPSLHRVQITVCLLLLEESIAQPPAAISPALPYPPNPMQCILHAPVNVVLELDVTKKVPSRVQGDCMAHSCLPLMQAVLIKGHDGLRGMQCSQI